ncbi:LamG domain-containing protein [Couchioplanes caeruleus]|uniref:LamG-like jellyroll fold domain-containing protein n=1 Tax=Couchioplanes caeruleus TaxID=56438 RepID=UPI0020BFA4E4|nr:LamG-like jellyroll fold domain-containing protein [Couchioplanes caeruleus]UQU66659.1 LamG domain-containing protein [Couchioplanes caeruleus]
MAFSLLLGGVATTLPASAVASPAPAAASSRLPGPAAAQDEGAALQKASSSDARVEVLSERTEFSQLFAEPDGRLTYESTVLPQRVRRDDGTWADLNLSLQATDAGVRPRAAFADVTFSDGGSEPLVTMVEGGKTFTLTWHGKDLPPPRLDADTATYPDVLPGVDLVVRPTELGFSHVLAVKSADAAKSSELREITFDVGGDAELSRWPDGSLRATAGGSLLATAPPPAMWDSRNAATPVKASGGTSGRVAAQGLDDDPSTGSGPSDAARVAAVRTEVTAAGDLVLRPDEAMLTGSATFPVFIDPYWDKGKTRWAYSTNNNTNNSDVSRARVGMDPDGRIYRSYFEFPLTTIKGKHVEEASVRMKLDHSYSCVDTWTHMFSASPISSTPRTAWKNSSLLKHLAATESHANEGSGCADSPQPDMTVNFEGGAITSLINSAAGKGTSNVTMAFSAGNETQDYENSKDRWKKFFPNDAKLIADVDAKPGKPYSLQVNNVQCKSTSIGIGIKDPFLSAIMPDGDDSQPLKATWQLYHIVGDKWTSMTPPPVSSTPANDREKSGRIEKAEDKNLYAFRVMGTDPKPYEIDSPWSDWCYFRIDTEEPDVSAVTLTNPPGPGQPGTFKIMSTATDVTTFRWGWESAVHEVPAKTVANEPGKSAVITATAPKYGDNLMTLQAVDSTLNEGDGTHPFFVERPAPPVAQWLLERYPYDKDDKALSDQAASVGGDTPLTAAGTSWADKQRVVGGRNVAFTGSGALTTGGKVLDTTKSFTVAAWVRIDQTTGFQNIISQDGAHIANFQLQYRSDDRNGDGTADKSFCFGMRVTDTDATAPMEFTCAPDSAIANRWTHVAGAYDAGEETMQVWVNGQRKAVKDAPAAWSSTGPMRVGNRKYTSDVWTDWLQGSVADVQVFDRVLVAQDFTGEPGDPNRKIADEPGIMTPVEAGRWDFADLQPCPDPSIAEMCQAPDQSSWHRRLSFTKGTGIGFGSGGEFLALDDQEFVWEGEPNPQAPKTREYGVTQANAAPEGSPAQWQNGTPLRTDQSFTVSAAVHVDSTSTTMTALAPKGNKQSAFFLGTRKSTVDSVTAQRFEVMVPSADADTGETYTHVIAKAPLDIDDEGSWTRLTVVYDAGAGTMSLYVNDRDPVTQQVPRLWNAAGPLIVGGGWWAADNTTGAWVDPWKGGIDDVVVYQGALTGVQVMKLVAGLDAG